MAWSTILIPLKYGLTVPSTVLMANLTSQPLPPSSQDLSVSNYYLSSPSVIGPRVEVAQERPPQQVAPPVNPRPNPNRDRFLQPIPPPKLPIPEKQPPVPETPPAPTEPTEPTEPSPLIPVSKIEVFGSSILSDSEIAELVKPWEGKEVTLEELRKVADEITERYLDRGYITSRAVLPQQTIVDGVVKIQVIEGKLTTITIQGNKRLQTNYIRSRIRLGAGVPLNTAKLEDQLRLLRVDPLFENVEASLRSGEKEGESILIVRITEANPFLVNFNIDNYSPPSIGSERLGVSVLHRNLTGRGDLAFISYNNSHIIGNGDADVFDFLYSLPVNAMNGNLQFRISPNANGIVQEPFNQFNIDGESQRYEVSFRQPLLRTPAKEFALSLGLSYQKGQTFADGKGEPFGQGPDDDGTTTNTAIKFGQDYLKRDLKGAWALRSQFTIGTGLFDGTSNPEPIPDANFFSWLGQVQRIQSLSKNNIAILQADIQLSANPLLPSQQFVMGGGQSLRGYRQNVRAGDNGIRFSIEDRITLERDANGAPVWQFAPFADLGYVWNTGDNPNKLPRQNFLAGVGIGVIWQMLPGVNIRLDYGLPLVDLDDRGNNAQDDGFYFSVNYTP